MNFDQAFGILVDHAHEGGFSNDPQDKGNWTGGQIGSGVCKGTKYGISAASYPGEDIEHLTLERAKELYARDFWGPAGCDAVPDILKYDLFDTAVNTSAPGHCVTAIKMLQHAVGETEDGVLGPHTLQALQSTPPSRLLFRFDAARLVYYAGMSDAIWLRFGRGLVKRVASNMVMV